MTKSDIKTTEEKPSGASAELAKLPIVGSSFGGRDINLGFAHRYAQDMAWEILSDLSDAEQDQLLEGILEVLEQWKDAHGKPCNNSLAGLLSQKREENISEQDREEKIKTLKPWQCH